MEPRPDPSSTTPQAVPPLASEHALENGAPAMPPKRRYTVEEVFRIATVLRLFEDEPDDDDRPDDLPRSAS